MQGKPLFTMREGTQKGMVIAAPHRNQPNHHGLIYHDSHTATSAQYKKKTSICFSSTLGRDSQASQRVLRRFSEQAWSAGPMACARGVWDGTDWLWQVAAAVRGEPPPLCCVWATNDRLTAVLFMRTGKGRIALVMSAAFLALFIM